MKPNKSNELKSWRLLLRGVAIAFIVTSDVMGTAS
jgi:hypothetical protein